MKKIIIATIAVFCGVSATYSQDASGALSGSKVMSVAEANRLNGVAQPTINGKPYSLYKAEQDALKKQREANNVSAKNANADVISVNASDARPTPAKPVPVVDASLTAKKVDAVTKSQPEVPQQFKLSAAIPWDGKPTTNMPVNTTIKGDPAQAVGANVVVETYTSKPLTDNTHSAEELKRAAQKAAYVSLAPAKVQPVTEKNEAAIVIPDALKIETTTVPAMESKPADSKVQPVTPNNPNAPKTKAN